MSRRPVGFGKKLHPGPQARRSPRRFGYSPLIRCQQCGWPNDSRTTAWATKGDGYSATPASSGASTGITVEMKNRAGCANCGSMNWHNGPPPQIEDDRKKPWK